MTTWCVTVTDEHGHAIGHGCANQTQEPQETRPTRATGRDQGRATVLLHGLRPARPAGRIRNLAAADRGRQTRPHGHPRPHHPPRDLRSSDSKPKVTTPSVELRRLFQGPARRLRRPDLRSRRPLRLRARCAVEGRNGRTCLCNGGPKCRRDHRLKQHPRWHVERLRQILRWTTHRDAGTPPNPPATHLTPSWRRTGNTWPAPDCR